MINIRGTEGQYVVLYQLSYFPSILPFRYDSLENRVFVDLLFFK